MYMRANHYVYKVHLVETFIWLSVLEWISNMKDFHSTINNPEECSVIYNQQYKLHTKTFLAVKVKKQSFSLQHPKRPTRSGRPRATVA